MRVQLQQVLLWESQPYWPALSPKLVYIYPTFQYSCVAAVSQQLSLADVKAAHPSEKLPPTKVLYSAPSPGPL